MLRKKYQTSPKNTQWNRKQTSTTFGKYFYCPKCPHGHQPVAL